MNKKVLAVLLTTLLLLSLLPAAAFAAENSVSDVKVEVARNTVKENSEYKIAFNSNKIMTGGLDTISIKFPSDFSFSSSWSAGAVDINGETSGGVDYTKNILTILLPKKLNIYGGQPVTVTLASGMMENPESKGEYTLSVYTSQETTPVTSAAFTISEYVYDDGVSIPHVTFDRVKGYAPHQITIEFSTNLKGQIYGGNSDQIIVTFPNQFKLPATMSASKITINGTRLSDVTPVITGQRLIIPLPTSVIIPGSYPVKLVLAPDCGITVSKAADKATLTVVTTKDTQPVTSENFNLEKTPEEIYVPAEDKNAEVKVSPNGAGEVAAWTFTIPANTLEIIDEGNIKGYTFIFPNGTIIPSSISNQSITVNGQQALGVLTDPTTRSVTFNLPLGVPKTQEAVVVISKAAGIQNPPAAVYIMEYNAFQGIAKKNTRSFEIKTESDPEETGGAGQVTERTVMLTLNSQVATVNGEFMQLDVPAQLIKGYTMVPIRFVMEGLGAEVEYDQAQNTVTMSLLGRTIILWPSSTLAKVDNTVVTLATEPYIKDGRTMVPLRFVSECFGANVEYVNATQPMTITLPSDALSKLPTVAEVQAAQTAAAAANGGSAGGGTSGGSAGGDSGSGGSSGSGSGGATGTVVGKTLTLKSGTSSANLRGGPGTTYDKVGILLPSEEATITEVSGDWYHIKFSYGLEAWVRNDLVTVK